MNNIDLTLLPEKLLGLMWECRLFSGKLQCIIYLCRKRSGMCFVYKHGMVSYERVFLSAVVKDFKLTCSVTAKLKDEYPV